MIDVCGLRKLYDDDLAVDGVSFSIAPGQICGLVGPNGAGKTTTMRCLAGLIPATSGSLRVADCDLTGDLIELKRRLAYVPDDPPLFDDLSVGEHLDFIGRLYRVRNHRNRAVELLEQFDLLHKIDAGATTLSRGMRQKLAICCAYLFDPQVLLLDEPLTGLDAGSARQVKAVLREHVARGVTIIMTTHILDVAERIGIIANGRLVSEGTLEELRNAAHEAGSGLAAASLEDIFLGLVGDGEVAA